MGSFDTGSRFQPQNSDVGTPSHDAMAETASSCCFRFLLGQVLVGHVACVAAMNLQMNPLRGYGVPRHRSPKSQHAEQLVSKKIPLQPHPPKTDSRKRESFLLSSLRYVQLPLGIGAPRLTRSVRHDRHRDSFNQLASLRT